MRRHGAVWAVVIVIGAVGLAACGSSSPSSSVTTTTAIAPAAALATGTYAPAGASGQPHYVITISSAENTQFEGAMNFVYQDGTTSHVFDFSGKVTGQNAVATPTNVAAPGSATRTVSSVPEFTPDRRRERQPHVRGVPGLPAPGHLIERLYVQWVEVIRPRAPRAWC